MKIIDKRVKFTQVNKIEQRNAKSKKKKKNEYLMSLNY